jgi:hypothetical protein
VGGDGGENEGEGRGRGVWGRGGRGMRGGGREVGGGPWIPPGAPLATQRGAQKIKTRQLDFEGSSEALHGAPIKFPGRSESDPHSHAIFRFNYTLSLSSSNRA